MPDLGWLFNYPVLRYLALGLGYTLALAAISIAISFVLGILLALARLSRFPLLRYPAVFYIETVRSLPLLLIIFFTGYAVPQVVEVPFEPGRWTFYASVIALSGFTAALLAEIIRAGILSVNRGLIEAAQSQGLTPLQVLRHVTLPIALRRMTPALVGQFITLLKDTSLTAAIGTLELTTRGRIVFQTIPPFNPIPVFALVAATYWVFCYGLSVFSRRLEERQA